MTSEDIKYGKDGVEWEGPPGGLEALLSSKRISSEPVTVKHGGEKKTVVFRELSNDLKQKIMTHAIQHVEDMRRTQEEDGKGEWRDAESDRDVLIGEERDLRMLQASMTDPETNGPACSLEWLRKRMGTPMQTLLGEKYNTFEASIDPREVTEEMIKIVIDDVKKNCPLDLLLMQYDSILLAKCVQYLVGQSESFQSDKSSGFTTGDEPPT